MEYTVLLKQPFKIKNITHLTKALEIAQKNWDELLFWDFCVSFSDEDNSVYIDIDWWGCYLRENRTINEIIDILLKEWLKFEWLVN